MLKLFRVTVCALLLPLICSSLYAQSDSDSEWLGDSCDTAYEQGQHAAHWSAYVPIAILIGASIWFGCADQRDEGSSSHNSSSSSSRHSPNGLGRLDSHFSSSSRNFHMRVAPRHQGSHSCH